MIMDNSRYDHFLCVLVITVRNTLRMEKTSDSNTVVMNMATILPAIQTGRTAYTTFSSITPLLCLPYNKHTVQGGDE